MAGALQILEQQHQLSFHLQQQRLIELIRQGKTEEALEHAQEYLAPPGEEDPAFLEELGMFLNCKTVAVSLCCRTALSSVSMLLLCSQVHIHQSYCELRLFV